jgi:hypothetical protein
VGVNVYDTWVMLSTGSEFSAPAQWDSVVFYGSMATLLGDTTGDGRADLVAVHDNDTGVMLSTGTGFSAPIDALQWSGETFYGTKANLLGDITGDGRADLVAVNDNATWVMLSTGTGFSAPAQWSSEPFFGTKATLIGDITGDGRADLVAVNDWDTWVMLSTGTAFSAPVRWSSTRFFGSRATLLGDITGDGKSDLVAVNVNVQL